MSKLKTDLNHTFNHRFGRPNMGALHGKVGKEILKTIQNTPPVDLDKLHRESREWMEKIREAKEEGSY